MSAKCTLQTYQSSNNYTHYPHSFSGSVQTNGTHFMASQAAYYHSDRGFARRMIGKKKRSESGVVGGEYEQAKSLYATVDSLSGENRGGSFSVTTI